jgi:peptidoglycan/xylan/chitin deacetylase (PgdA/CDA1 family)
MGSVRHRLKRALAALPAGPGGGGARILIYHRVGGGSPDERDVATADFSAQLDCLDLTSVRHLDEALEDLKQPSVVLTFDDGFRDVYENAWPLLRERQLPFTVYLATAYVGGQMHWDGSTAKAAGPGLAWGQLETMVASGLCTVGNHTHTHARPERVTADELDRCTDLVEERLGLRPAHFAYTWGLPAPGAEPLVRARFRSAVLGRLGVNQPGQDPHRLLRIPVRRTDPLPFFRAKLGGGLTAERAYAAVVGGAKRVGVRA